jgi:hypothetical protein
MPKRSRRGVVIRLDRTRAGAFADHKVELEIFHRGIKDFLDRRIEAVDFIDEQHIARLEIGEDRCEIAGPGQHGARGRTEIDAQLAGHNLRQRRLAEARWSREQHMVERFGAGPRRLDEYREIFPRLLLAHELGQPLGPHTRLERILLRARRCDEAVDFGLGLRRGHRMRLDYSFTLRPVARSRGGVSNLYGHACNAANNVIGFVRDSRPLRRLYSSTDVRTATWSPRNVMACGPSLAARTTAERRAFAFCKVHVRI